MKSPVIYFSKFTARSFHRKQPHSLVIEKHFFEILDQRNLGMSMKVERSSLDQVRQRFEMNKRKQEEKKKEYDFNERMKELHEEVISS